MRCARVDLTVGTGEILGLVGENGAGKSTLIKILSGAYARDAGEIRVAGEPVPTSAAPHEMIARGVAVIYQEPSLAPHLTVAENIFMGRCPAAPRDRRLGAAVRRHAARWRSGSDSTSSRSCPSAHLSVARRQMVEIAKALSREARIIVLDEPSAVLGRRRAPGPVRGHASPGRGTASPSSTSRIGWTRCSRSPDRVTVHEGRPRRGARRRRAT